MKKFEYMIVNELCKLSSLSACGVTERNQENQLIHLNRLGAEGWEMCGNIGTKTNSFIFKREVTK